LKAFLTSLYYYDGTLLVAEESKLRTIVYIYDVTGSPIGFKYKAPSYAADTWDVYYYTKNLQGDIVAVYSSTGTKLISYVYTAWGSASILYTNEGLNSTAFYNPFRYRGYYYDSDLGMYYLQSRYYDANICRFINPDRFISTGQGLTGYNMFAYCGNNPIAFMDITGESLMPFWELVWPGEIHSAVQDYIIKQNRVYEREISVTGGRIDLVFENDAYEIKPFTYNSPAGRRLAKEQLQRYTQNSKYSVGSNRPELTGVFYYETYIVTYYYQGEGLIFYDFRKNTAPRHEDIFVLYRENNSNSKYSYDVNKQSTSTATGLGMAGVVLVFILIAMDDFSPLTRHF